MENNYKLYVHICPNGKRYYGITKQEPKRRWNNGKSYKNNQHFTNAINKYGWDNIEHIVLFDSLAEHEAKELEQYYIQWYDTANRDYGYNISLGGDANNHSEETKKKMSDIHKGHIVSDETKKKISKNHADVSGENHPMYGKHHSDETKKKISKNNSRFWKGKQLSEDTKKKMSRPIICITTNQIFYGLSEAERQYGVPNSNIVKCCQGKRKSAGKSPTGEKLIWKYIDIKEIV